MSNFVSGEAEAEKEASTSQPSSTFELSQHLLEIVKRDIRDRLSRGNVDNSYLTDNLLDTCYECSDGDFPDDFDFSSIIDEIRNEVIEEQKLWTHTTHNDLLDLAEKELDSKHNIIFVQDINTTPSSCWYEIDEEIQKRGGEDRYVGAAYYHFQSTERAIEHGLLYIHFGVTDYGKVQGVLPLSIKTTVLKVFAELKLPVASSNTLDVKSAIELNKFVWQKRLVPLELDV